MALQVLLAPTGLAGHRVAGPAVMKMRSPMKTGLDAPAPGRSVFHATVSVLLQVTGSPFSRLIPDPSGPRNRGQSAAGARAARKKATSANGMRHGIGSAPGAASVAEYITHTLPQRDLAAESKNLASSPVSVGSDCETVT